MDVRVRFFEESCIVDGAGEIDMYNASRLEDLVYAVMEKKVCAFIFNPKRYSTSTPAALAPFCPSTPCWPGMRSRSAS